MILHRDRSTYAPRFFPGQAGCYCCSSAAYHVKVFENNSGTLELARRDMGNTTSQFTSGLQWDGTNLYVQHSLTGTPEPADRVSILDVDLQDVQVITHDYNFGGATQTSKLRWSNLAPTGEIIFQSRRTTGTNRGAVVSKASDDSLNWETNLDVPSSGSVLASSVAADSAGNVFCTEENLGVSTIYMFDNTGTKQWKTSLGANSAAGLLVVDTDDYCWTVNIGPTFGDSTIRRLDTTGSIVLTITLTGMLFTDTYSSFCSDGGTGVWVYVRNSGGTTREIRRYDSSGTLVTTISSTTFLKHFAVDTSNNVYALCSGSGTTAYIKKYNSSGTLQWTSSGIGWNTTGTSSLADIAVDSNYIFVCGGYNAS